jgi:TIR domain-containing protein
MAHGEQEIQGRWAAVDAWQSENAELVDVSVDYFLAQGDWPDTDELTYRLYKRGNHLSDDIVKEVWPIPRELAAHLSVPRRFAFRVRALRDRGEAQSYVAAIPAIARLAFETYDQHGPRGRVSATDVIHRVNIEERREDRKWGRLMALLENEPWLFAAGHHGMRSRDWWRSPHPAAVSFRDISGIDDYLYVSACLFWEHPLKEPHASAVYRHMEQPPLSRGHGWDTQLVLSRQHMKQRSGMSTSFSQTHLSGDSDARDRWDLFISHASEDKAVVAEPLVAALMSKGWQVWYDRTELTLGDRLRTKIDEGLAKCKFGVVIVSEAFLSKRWPQEELDALFARETAGAKVILPVWVGVSSQTLLRHSPLLAARLAVRWEDGVQHVVDEIERVLGTRSTRRPGVAVR